MSLYTFYKEERPVFLNEQGWQNNDGSNVVTPGAKGLISGSEPYCSPWRIPMPHKNEDSLVAQMSSKIKHIY